VERFIDRHYQDYWMRTDTDRQIEHAKILKRAEKEGLHLATETTTDAFTAITELTVIAPNHPRLLALFAGACAAAGANIAGAHIMTTRDGFALDTFLLNREFKDDEDELRRGRRISGMIERLLRGDAWMRDLMAARGAPPRRIMAFTVEPEVIINNALSDEFTVIEVAGRDRPGLLYEVTSTMSNLFLDITSAHITTFGEKAVDVFYVTDLTGKKITSESRQATIRETLEKVLEGTKEEVAAGTAAKS
jgi:[protein-PII] uridylyltransferase